VAAKIGGQRTTEETQRQLLSSRPRPEALVSRITGDLSADAVATESRIKGARAIQIPPDIDPFETSIELDASEDGRRSKMPVTSSRDWRNIGGAKKLKTTKEPGCSRAIGIHEIAERAKIAGRHSDFVPRGTVRRRRKEILRVAQPALIECTASYPSLRYLCVETFSARRRTDILHGRSADLNFLWVPLLARKEKSTAESRRALACAP